MRCCSPTAALGIAVGASGRPRFSTAGRAGPQASVTAPQTPRPLYKSRGREISRKSGDLDAGISNPRDAETPEGREEPRDPSSPAPGAGGPWARERPPTPPPKTPAPCALLSKAFCVTSRRPLPELPRPRSWRLCLDFLCSLHTLDQGFPIPLLDLVPSPPRRSLLELCLSPPGASPVPSLPSPGFPVSPPRPAPVFINLAPRARVGERPRLSG